MKSKGLLNLNIQGRMIASLMALAGVLFTALPTSAAEAKGGAGASASGAKYRFDAVAPYIDENAYGAAYVDLSRVDTRAIETWVNDVAKAAHADPDAAKTLAEGMAIGRQAVDGWIASFTKAGGRQLYVVMSLVDLPNPPVIIVPLADGADARAIKELFTSAPPVEHPHSYGFSPEGDAGPLLAEQIGSVVVIAPGAALRRIHERKRADRPDVDAALAAAGDAPFAVAMAPPADTRRVVEETMPRLAPELGGGASAALTRGLLWISLAVHLPPDASINLTLRTRDAESAKELAGIVDKSLSSLGRQMETEQDLASLAKLTRALSPTASPDHPEELRLALDQTAIARLLASQLPDQLLRSRARGRAAESQRNIRQFLLACAQYADEHKGDWPDDMKNAITAAGVGGEVLADPGKSGYTYISPGKASDIKDYRTRMVIYETDPKPTGRNIGFADGHAESITEIEFQKYLKAARESAGERRK